MAQILLDANGRRDMRNRPYIDKEETTLGIALWNPHVPYHYGLYDGNQPVCGWWQPYAQRAFADGFASAAGYITPAGQTMTYMQYGANGLTPVDRRPAQPRDVRRR